MGFEDFAAHATTCEAFFAKTWSADQAKRVTHAIVNPPRGGLSLAVAKRLSPKDLPALEELRYVSCNPESLARDLKVLVGNGLKVTSVEPFDMFPQTGHVEVVVRAVSSSYRP